MVPFAVLVALFALAAGAFAFALRRFRRTAVWFTAAMLVLFPLLSDTSDWFTWFAWVKRYSVVFPAFLWAFLHAYPEHVMARWTAKFIPVLLMVNVLEAGVLELQGPSPLNGALLIVVGLCVPWRFTLDARTRQLGFRDVLWQLACLLTLARLYALNPTFENITAGAIIVLLLASLSCAVERDSQGYVGWRLYTLYFLILQDSLLPTWSDPLYPDWMHNDRRALGNGTLGAKLWLGLNVLVVAALVFRRVRALVMARSIGNTSVASTATP